MKATLFIILFVFSLQGVAGMKYYHESLLNTYDRATGLYFNAIEKKVKEGGFISSGHRFYTVNIAIFDPKTGKITTVFNDNKFRKIEKIWFESYYHTDGRSIQFNEGRHFRRIKNNHDIVERAPKNKLLFAIYNVETKLNELWTVSKQGDHLKMIKAFSDDYNWHIDIKNAKIRFVKQIDNKLHIESLDW